MSANLKGRVAIVTGAARGIGAAIAEALLQNGCKVCIADILEDEGNKACETLKDRYGDESVCFRATDVTKRDSFEGVFKDIIKHWGGVTILAHNAGIAREDEYERMISINLVSYVTAGHLALQYMGKDKGGQGGNVVFTASILGLIPCERIPAYTASKFGAVGLVQCFSGKVYESSGVRFAALCPGVTDTPLVKPLLSKHESGEPHLLSSLMDVKGMEGVSTTELIAGGAIQLLKDNRNGAALIAHCNLDGHYRYLSDSHFDADAILAATTPANSS
ncbi:15-hydroxyprostaglandin dehydrogenase [NAD(+)]-like [Ornithodoros turicata]|uniref:15-hydroxyprostaglandin dehydrogenase [NAD(+)]-like n=1 Tax=Ornithodoros turicata TaxID=34597 RepID=UPI00313883A5